MIYSDIKNFARQFEFEPKIENKSVLKKRYAGYILAGMGGSHLAADILECWQPEFPLTIRSAYGLPPIKPKEFRKYLVIASSYSGNTEETIDAAKLAHKNGCPLAVIASGGKLLEFAKMNRIPYIALPSEEIQPRMALGWSLRALLALVRNKKGLRETGILARILTPSQYEKTGKKLARKLWNRIPIIYASSENAAVAKIWKIKLNETGKIPSFWNVLPELNHNEMTGFDLKENTKGLSKQIHILLIRDDDDDLRIRKRADILEKLYEKKGLGITELRVSGRSRIERIFNSILLADWTSYCIARGYGVEPEAVPMVEEFKKAIKN